MKTYARAVNGIGLPLLGGFTSFAWYASRTMMYPLLREVGDFEAYADLMGTGRWVSLAAFFVGGLLAVAGTPWAALCTGLFLCMIGLAWMGVADPDGLTAPFLLAMFGRSMSTVGLWGALAHALSGEREGLRNAAFVVTYTAVNLGLTVLTAGREVFAESEPNIVQLVAAAFYGMALFVALAVAAVSFVGRRRAEDPPEPAPKPGPLALGVLGLFALASFPLAFGWPAYSLSYPVLELDWLNPAIVTVVGLTAAAAMAGLHFTKLRLPTALPVGAGMFLWGFGAVVILFAVPAQDLYGDSVDANETLVLLATIIGAAGEVLLIPLLYSRMAADLPYRLGSGVIALHLLATQTPSTILYALGQADLVDATGLDRLTGWTGGLTAVLFGLVLAAAAWPARRLFWPPESDADETEPADESSPAGAEESME